jgi:serine/threonine protein kinase
MGDAARGFSSTKELPIPRMLGRRVLLKLAARGGMGDVYLAATTGIEGAERPCIVKTVRRDHIHDGSFLARFLDEARVQAQLQHPGVAQVLEAATDENGEPFTVVELVEGKSLSDVRQRALQSGVRIGWADAAAVAIEIAQALAHVHERPGTDGAPLGIVHRDLSPQNVMVGFAGEVKLIDFGTARGHNRKCHTVAGVVFAKPGYVAPEVARQQVGDGRIDLYALGVMLWETCAGRRFLTTDPQKHLDDAAAGTVVLPPIAVAVGAPLVLDDIIANLTKNEPADRYSRAGLAAADLAKLLAQAPAAEGGERGVRGRISALMKRLWPFEPARTRAEFARLLREARETLETTSACTPSAPRVAAGIAAKMAPEDPAVLAGTPYRLGKRLGEGESGVVYEAEHVELGRKIALKVLAPAHTASPAALDRFRREARAVARLSHPNLVQLYDFGRSLDGRVYFAMELLHGTTLDARIADGALPWTEAARVAIETATALEAAHAAGLVHRDIKPHNLMLTQDGGVRLLDFGVATALTDPQSKPSPDGKDRLLKGFAIFGTPEYMAPEQVSGDVVDARTDVYALGCVLYEMLTGARAFEGGSSVVVMGKQLRETPEPPRVRAPAREIPRAIDAVVVRAMAKKPQDRFESAAAMRVALEEACAAPDKRRTRVRRVASAAVLGASLFAAAAVSAQLVRTHASLLSSAPPPVALASASSSPPPTATPTFPPAPPPTALAATTVPAPPPSLREARSHARAHPSDPRALRAWTLAAWRAGETREARRAANSWMLHDGTAEPRMTLASILDAVGRRDDARAVLAGWLEQHPDADDARAELSRLAGDAPPHEVAKR